MWLIASEEIAAGGEIRVRLAESATTISHPPEPSPRLRAQVN